MLKVYLKYGVNCILKEDIFNIHKLNLKRFLKVTETFVLITVAIVSRLKSQKELSFSFLRSICN